MRDSLRLVGATLGSLLLLFLVFGELATALAQPRWLNWHLTLPVVVVAAIIVSVTWFVRHWAREPVSDCRCGGTHNWVGCYCSKCLAIRSEGHDLDQCVCRACKEEFHVWDEGRTCSKCGLTRDEVYPPGLCYTCDVWRHRAFEDVAPPFVVQVEKEPQSANDFLANFIVLGHAYHAAKRGEDAAGERRVFEEALVLWEKAGAAGLHEDCLRACLSIRQIPGYGVRTLNLIGALRKATLPPATGDDAMPIQADKG